MINSTYAGGRCPLDGLVPLPHNRLTGTDLEKDPWLGKTCKAPGYLATFEQRLEERKTVEARLEEFCFAPLKVTLRNMQTFIGHIRAGHQFAGRLTDKEDRAMAWAEATAEELLTAGAPYKRTVWLAIALMTLCEIITDRQVLAPLRSRWPCDLWRGYLNTEKDWSRQLALAGLDESLETVSAAALDPEKVAALSWGGAILQPDGGDILQPDGGDILQLAGSRNLADLLQQLIDRINDPRLVLYPSFEELDIDDFCLFGHLSLYPVGLTTDYAMGADGAMMSPLAFAFHDLQHMLILDKIGDPLLRSNGEPWARLLAHDRRLAFRCLVLDQLPACLALLRLESALILLLFQLFHETSPTSAVTVLLDNGAQSFLWCLCGLAKARREARNGYSKAWQEVSDAQAALACCWTLRLWQLCKTTLPQPLAPAALEACARDFLDRDVPLLQEHLAFVDHQRGALRQLFADPAFSSLSQTPDGHIHFYSGDHFIRCGNHGWFHSFSFRCGLRNLDDTDIAYFAALPSAVLYQALQDRFGEDLPGGRLFGHQAGADIEEAMALL